MAGENSLVADSSIGIGPHQRHEAAGAEAKTATQVLQGDSLWQTARAEQGIPKPYDPTGQMGLPEATRSRDPIKMFSPEGSTSGFKRTEPLQEDLAPPAKTKEGSELFKRLEIFPREPEIEKRARLLAEFEQHLSDQNYYSQGGLAGVGTLTAGALLARASTPAGLLAGAVGIGTSIYSAYRLTLAEEQAAKTLKQMPLEDRERFQKYQADMQAAKGMGSKGYIIGGGVALISMSKVTPYINTNVSNGAFLAALANDTYQTMYAMPNVKSAFVKDYQAWKQEQKQKQEVRK